MRINTSLVGEYDFYVSCDDAWETGAEITKGPNKGKPNKARKRFLDAWGAATQTGEYSNVPRKDGQSPVRWTLTHVGSRHLRSVMQEVDAFNAGKAADRRSTPWLAVYRAARLGLRSVEGLFNGDEAFTIEIVRDARLETECVSHDSMDCISRIKSASGLPVGGMIINEIGLHVIGGGSPSKKS